MTIEITKIEGPRYIPQYMLLEGERHDEAVEPAQTFCKLEAGMMNSVRTVEFISFGQTHGGEIIFRERNFALDEIFRVPPGEEVTIEKKYEGFVTTEVKLKAKGS